MTDVPKNLTKEVALNNELQKLLNPLLSGAKKFITNHRMSNQWNVYQRLLDFKSSELKNQNMLEALCNKVLEKKNGIHNLSQSDVTNIFCGIAEILFDDHRLSRNLIECNTGLLNGSKQSITINNHVPKQDPSFNNDNRDVIAIFIQTIREFDKKWASNKTIIQIRLPFQTNMSVFNVNIDDRIKINGKSNAVEIEAIYIGSAAKCELEMRLDIPLIRALLEYEKVILDPSILQSELIKGQLFPAETDCAKPQITFQSDSTSVSLELLKENIQYYLGSQYVMPHCTMHLDYFNLLKKNFERSELKTAIYFFNGDKEFLPSFQFLKYWFAIEVMLGSEEEQHQKSLMGKYKLVCPKGDMKEFKKFYKLRCEMVHNGKFYIKLQNIKRIEKIARDIFDRLFMMHECLRPI